eukprot:935379-Rhodomonas_salina.3
MTTMIQHMSSTNVGISIEVSTSEHDGHNAPLKLQALDGVHRAGRALSKSISYDIDTKTSCSPPNVTQIWDMLISTCPREDLKQDTEESAPRTANVQPASEPTKTVRPLRRHTICSNIDTIGGPPQVQTWKQDPEQRHRRAMSRAHLGKLIAASPEWR